MRRYVIRLDDRQTDFPDFIGGQRVWPGLGDAASDLKEQQKRFKDDMIRAVAKVTAVQMGISIVLMCFGPIGAAIAAVIALVQLIVGNAQKKRLKSIMDGIKQDILAHQKEAQERVHAAENQIAEQVWPEAAQLAASGQPLSGLGSLWTNVRDAVSKAAKDTAKVVVKIHNEPVKLIGRGVIKGVRSFATVVHDTKMVKRLDNKEAAWNTEIDRSTKHTAAALADIRVAAAGAKHAVAIVDGEESINVAREKGALLKQKAFASIDSAESDAMAGMQTPEYRAQVIDNLARAMRGDPKIASDAAYFQTQEQPD